MPDRPDRPSRDRLAAAERLDGDHRSQSPGGPRAARARSRSSRRRSSDRSRALGLLALFCFMAAASELPTGWHLNVAGMLGLAALYQWQRMRPAVGVMGAAHA